MKFAGCETSWAVSIALLLAVSASPVHAHTQNGSLGAGATATDYYQVTCSDDGSGPPGSLVTQVASLTSTGGGAVTGPSAPLMRHLPAPVSPTPGSTAAASVVVHKGNIAITSSDLTGGDADGSPLVYVNGGDGVYDIFVNKAATGAVNYTLQFHCMTGVNGGGIHTGSDIVIKQRGAP